MTQDQIRLALSAASLTFSCFALWYVHTAPRRLEKFRDQLRSRADAYLGYQCGCDICKAKRTPTPTVRVDSHDAPVTMDGIDAGPPSGSLPDSKRPHPKAGPSPNTSW